MALGLAVAALILAVIEKEKKYILSKIGMAVSGFLVIVWAVLIIIGFGG